MRAKEFFKEVPMNVNGAKYRGAPIPGAVVMEVKLCSAKDRPTSG